MGGATVETASQAFHSLDGCGNSFPRRPFYVQSGKMHANVAEASEAEHLTHLPHRLRQALPRGSAEVSCCFKNLSFPIQMFIFAMPDEEFGTSTSCDGGCL
jgi:hypothetical protein